MDRPSQALRKVREDVVASRAWSRLQEELLSQMRRSVREGQLRTAFVSLSPDEKLATVERAVEAVGDTPAYARLQAQVASAVDRHFSSLVFHPSQVAQEDSATSVAPPARRGARPLSEACSVLLQSSPHLKHSLKYALNHPLPPRLRLSAWRSLLRRPDVQKDFLVAGNEMQPRDATEREIQRRCRDILRENPAFGVLAGSGTALTAMQTVMLYWKQRTSGEEVPDSELLLCVPFVHVWREELERRPVGAGEGEGRLLFAEMAAEYVHFMEMLPPSISSSTTESVDGGMSRFSQRVVDLLHTEDPQLHKALQKALKRKTRGPQRRGAGGSSFHHVLKSVLLPHVQKMLVGDVSMDVLCYIWDQCLIGLDVPEYQCLPYFTAIWLILLRERLLKASSVEAVEEILSVHSNSLTTLQFQQEMEKTFLSDLSQSLKVKPLPLNPTQSHPLLPPLHHPSHPHPSQRPLSHPPPLSPNALPVQSPSRGQRTRHISTTGGNTEKYFRQRMEEMQQKIEREQKLLSHRIREEREQHQKQLEMFRKELEDLRVGLGGREKRRQLVGQSESLGQSLRSPVQSSSTTQQPTLLLVETSKSTPDKLQSMRVIPVQLTSHHRSLEGGKDRPYSPTNLSESDVEALWLQILQRFTAAAYTICHGTGSERQALLSSLQSPTTHNNTQS